MAKEDVVLAQKAIVLAAQEQALVDGLGACYDQGLIDHGISQGTLTQEDLDNAVSKAIADQKAADDVLLTEAQDKAKADMDDLQKKFNDLSAKEQVEAGVIGSLQDSLSKAQESIKAVFDLLKV